MLTCREGRTGSDAAPRWSSGRDSRVGWACRPWRSLPLHRGWWALQRTQREQRQTVRLQITATQGVQCQQCLHTELSVFLYLLCIWRRTINWTTAWRTVIDALCLEALCIKLSAPRSQVNCLWPLQAFLLSAVINKSLLHKVAEAEVLLIISPV